MEDQTTMDETYIICISEYSPVLQDSLNFVVKSSIKPESPRTKELAEVNIFLMDETTMIPKYGLRNTAQLLRSTAYTVPLFNGKVITVLGGV